MTQHPPEHKSQKINEHKGVTKMAYEETCNLWNQNSQN
jgi:hypothetical protein